MQKIRVLIGLALLALLGCQQQAKRNNPHQNFHILTNAGTAAPCEGRNVRLYNGPAYLLPFGEAGEEPFNVREQIVHWNDYVCLVRETSSAPACEANCWKQMPPPTQ